MKKLITLLLLLFQLNMLSFSQTTIYDCVGAIPLCDSIYEQGNIIGAVGNVINEINATTNGCLIQEFGGVWYKFIPTTTDTFRFSIIPYNLSGEDYDWALFNLTGVNCSVLAVDPYPYMISANSAGASSSIPPLQNQGPTGINSNNAIVGGGNCLGPGPGDGSGNSPLDWNTFNNDVVVNAGDVYYLYVAQFSGSQGYTLDFTASQASIISDVDPTITLIDSLCLLGDTVHLSAVDSGGIWSGLGVVDSINGVFDPSVSNTGIHEVIYTIESICIAADTTYVNVLPELISSFDYVALETHCTEVTISLQNNSINATSFEWYKNGEFISASENEIINILNNGTANVSLVASNDVCLDTSALVIDVLSNDILIIPNVLTPNGDGSNDVFKLSENMSECLASIKIYNRWGLLLYESADFVSWNGKNSGGKIVSSGTYFYTLAINEAEYKGTITLLK